MEPTSSEKLQTIWSYILNDPQARKALATLKKKGFAIDHLTPNGLEYPCWEDLIAMVPLLPDTPSHRRIYRGKALEKHRPLVRALRLLTAQARTPYCEIWRVKKTVSFPAVSQEFHDQLEQAADIKRCWRTSLDTTRQSFLYPYCTQI